MSRINLEGNRPTLELVVGLDRPLQQWFYQVWDSAVSNEEPILDSISKSCPISGPSRGEMLEVIQEYARTSPLRHLVEQAIALDIDPEDLLKPNH